MPIRSKRDREKYNANVRIPETLTSYLREFLLQLPPGPKNDHLRAEVFSKFVDSETSPPIVRRQRAINKWLATEANNEATNVRLMTLCEDYNIIPRVSYSVFRDVVQRFIVDVIGESPSWDSLFGGFSGGASTSRQRTSSHPATKYLGQADVTPRAWDWASEVLSESPVWSSLVDEDYINVTDGNVMFTVPKNAEIDRCACKEPDLNMYLQRGLGNQIAKGLRRVGIDLNDQSRNRCLAQVGSQDNSLATLDLSSASDSISREVVFQLLPEVWFTALDSTRSEFTWIDGELHKNEMFSSMGNGFTFELESLIFYCVARATAFLTNTRGIISVYGDDIICPSDMSDTLQFVLQTLGFEVNSKKSYSDGPFRESCGGHYHYGYDITPFYVKAPLLRLVDLIHVCNQIRRWSLENNNHMLSDTLEELWIKLSSHVPFRFWGGHDTAFKGRLVSYRSPDRPMRLLPTTKDLAIPDSGRYLLWLNNGMDRESGLTQNVISAQRTLGTYRTVKCSPNPFINRDLVPYFLSEVTTE